MLPCYLWRRRLSHVHSKLGRRCRHAACPVGSGRGSDYFLQDHDGRQARRVDHLGHLDPLQDVRRRQRYDDRAEDRPAAVRRQQEEAILGDDDPGDAGGHGQDGGPARRADEGDAGAPPRQDDGRDGGRRRVGEGDQGRCSQDRRGLLLPALPLQRRGRPREGAAHDGELQYEGFDVAGRGLGRAGGVVERRGREQPDGPALPEAVRRDEEGRGHGGLRGHHLPDDGQEHGHDARGHGRQEGRDPRLGLRGARRLQEGRIALREDGEVVGPLVTTGWLAERLGEPGLRVVDVRWYLGEPERGRAAYAAGHIPEAVFVDAETELSAPGGRRGGPLGRHPWPEPEQVARVMGAAGIGNATRVVAYDDLAGGVAARLWYLLRAYGHDAVAVLDGGLVKWVAEGRPVTAAAAVTEPATFLPRPRPGFVLTKEDVLAHGTSAVVLDARIGERYRGEVEPIDPRAGHIPGAKSAPYVENLTVSSTPVFRSPDELRQRYAVLGADRHDPIVYCGSGITACHDLLALELAGLRGRLYGGSWSEWSSDPALPVETGNRS